MHNFFYAVNGQSSAKTDHFKKMLRCVPKLHSSLLSDHLNMICGSSDKPQTYPNLHWSTASVFTILLLRLLQTPRPSICLVPFPLQCVLFLTFGSDGLPFLSFPPLKAACPSAFSWPPYPSGSRMRKQEVEAITYCNLAVVRMVYRLKSPFLSYF